MHLCFGRKASETNAMRMKKYGEPYQLPSCYVRTNTHDPQINFFIHIFAACTHTFSIFPIIPFFPTLDFPLILSYAFFSLLHLSLFSCIWLCFLLFLFFSNSPFSFAKNIWKEKEISFFCFIFLVYFRLCFPTHVWRRKLPALNSKRARRFFEEDFG